jgi:hypothetical protein
VPHRVADGHDDGCGHRVRGDAPVRQLTVNPLGHCPIARNRPHGVTRSAWFARRRRRDLPRDPWWPWLTAAHTVNGANGPGGSQHLACLLPRDSSFWIEQ